jgi:hypothetical protein
MWLAWASDGHDRKLPADLHNAVNFPQCSATAVEKENVLICVRGVNSGRAIVGALRYWPRSAPGSKKADEMSDNEPVEARAALLIAAAPDPASQGKVIFHVVKELSEADYDRYAEA